MGESVLEESWEPREEGEEGTGSRQLSYYHSPGDTQNWRNSWLDMEGHIVIHVRKYETKQV